MTKYTINKIEVTEAYASDSTFIKGKMYRIQYTEEKFVWWKLKIVKTQKEVFKRPFMLHFRNASDGYVISNKANTCLNNYIECMDL